MRVGRDQFRIEPGLLLIWHAMIIGAVSVMIAVAAWMIPLPVASKFAVTVLFPTLGFGMPLWGHVMIQIAGTRVIFDRATNAAMFKGYRFRRELTMPLERIVAVQLCDARELWTGDKRRHAHAFQLNLVLQGESIERINLIDARGLKSIRQIGAETAAFLGVPLIDGLRHV